MISARETGSDANEGTSLILAELPRSAVTKALQCKTLDLQLNTLSIWPADGGALERSCADRAL